MIGLMAMAAVAAASPTESAMIFQAAGARRRGAGWAMCSDDPGASATIAEMRDINGDGRPDAVVTEDSSFCGGGAGTTFAVVSKQTDGKWRRMAAMPGVPEFLRTKGTGGWPDLSVGGPGFCFPVLRWNGSAYANNRMEYEGKFCRR